MAHTPSTGGLAPLRLGDRPPEARRQARPGAPELPRPHAGAEWSPHPSAPLFPLPQLAHLAPSSLPLQAKKDAKEAAERKRREAAKVAQARKEAAAAPKISGPPVKEAELLKAHGKIREHFSTRFNDVRRGSRPSPLHSPRPATAQHRSPLPDPFPRRCAAASACSTRTSRGR